MKRKLDQGPLDLESIENQRLAEFRCRVYENGRVAADDSMKKDIRSIGTRELRRKGIGQHTIERALSSTVKKRTYAKLLTVIEICKHRRKHT